MSDVLIFVVAGLVAGSVYSLAGVGLVLTYRTTGVFNFAHGSIAAVAAYLFFTLHVTEQMDWRPAAAITILTVGVGLGTVLELLGRGLARATLAQRVAATVGLLLAIEAVIRLTHDDFTVRMVPPFLPQDPVDIEGVAVTTADLITIAIGIVATAGLSTFLQLSRTGRSMRALVDDPDLLGTAGVNPQAVRRVAWIVGATMAATAGVLFAPLLPLDPVQLTLIVVAAFGAAAMGAFRSLWLTLLGGLGIGVGAALATRYLTEGILIGVAPSLPFLVLFGVLLVLPRSKVARPPLPTVRIAPRWYGPTWAYAATGAVTVAVLVAAPSFAGIRLSAWTTAAAIGVVLLSLGLLVSTSGQVSLCQVSFAAIGACTMSHLAVGNGMPWGVALVLSGLVVVPVGVLLAVPAIRLSGLYLALATFGFGLLLQYMFYTQDYMFGSTGSPLTQRRPGAFESDTAFHYLTVAIAVSCVVLVLVVERSRLGRLLRGVADAPTTLQTSGASVDVTRVLVFCLSAFLAGVGGALTGSAQLTSDAGSFSPFLSLLYLAVIVMVAVRAPWNAVLGAAGLVLVPAYLDGDDTTAWLQVLFGAGVLLVVLVPDRWRRLPLTPRAARSPLAVPEAPDAGSASIAVPADQCLELQGITVRFGGVTAVDSLDLVAPAGTITGLIGPNGAGKTTTFNCCTGLVRPAAGKVVLDGRDITSRRPAARARLGLGRTFQKLDLFETRTVAENVALGAEAAAATGNPLRHLAASPASRRDIARRTAAALDTCGITDLASRRVSDLSTGQRRLVDLARCLAGEHEILLLDEPSSGLDPGETAAFAAILRRIVSERGVGLLLVEHDLSLVLDVCSRIYVLDFGELLFEGTATEVIASPVVRAAYLGEQPEPAPGIPATEVLA